MDKVIVFSAGKGGVGKSTLAFNIAYELTKIQAQAVILISSDPSRSTEYLTGISSEKDIPGWFDYLVKKKHQVQYEEREIELEDILFKTPYKMLYTIACAKEDPFNNDEIFFRGVIERLIEFKEYVDSSQIGIIILDTPGSLVDAHYIYAKLFQTVLITTPATLDLEGGRQLLKLNKILPDNKKIKYTIVNKCISPQEIKKVKQTLPDAEVIASVSSLLDFELSCSEKRPISLYAPNSKGAKEIKAAAKAIYFMSKGEMEPEGVTRGRVKRGVLSEIYRRVSTKIQSL